MNFPSIQECKKRADKLANDLGPGWIPWVRSYTNGSRHYGARYPAGIHVIDVCAMSGGDSGTCWRAAVCYACETNAAAIVSVMGPLAVTKMTPREAIEALIALFTSQKEEVDQLVAALNDIVMPLLTR